MDGGGLIWRRQGLHTVVPVERAMDWAGVGLHRDAEQIAEEHRTATLPPQALAKRPGSVGRRHPAGQQSPTAETGHVFLSAQKPSHHGRGGGGSTGSHRLSRAAHMKLASSFCRCAASATRQFLPAAEAGGRGAASQDISPARNPAVRWATLPKIPPAGEGAEEGRQVVCA